MHFRTMPLQICNGISRISSLLLRRLVALGCGTRSRSFEFPMSNAELQKQIQRRKTFAIISHPDAGKTTLTEKLLLYGGAIHQAGAVKARKSQRHATSDWMALEQERGISVTSSVLQFEYHGYQVNLLDTPGHPPFGEATYPVHIAPDVAETGVFQLRRYVVVQIVTG